MCTECGHRQPAGDRCASCGYDPLLSLGKSDTLDLMLDIEQRLTDRRAARIRIGSVVVALAVVFGLWMVPGYWGLRGRVYPGLPFFADQWFFMILIGLGLSKLLEHKLARRRFPYLDNDGKLIS